MQKDKRTSFVKIIVAMLFAFLGMCCVSFIIDKVMNKTVGSTSLSEKDKYIQELEEILAEQEKEKENIGLSIEEIKHEDYKVLLENKESFILYVGRSTCPDCERFEPVLDSIQFKSEIKHIDTQSYKDAITNEEDGAQDAYDSFKSDVGYEWIPYVCAIKDGQVISEFDFEFPEKFSDLSKEDATAYIEDMHSRFVKWLVEYQNQIYQTDMEIIDEDACEIDTRCD